MITFNLVEAVQQAKTLNSRFRPVGNTEWMYLHGSYICECGDKYNRDVPFSTKVVLARFELEAFANKETHECMSGSSYQESV